ncbi:MAG: PilN domain-containing protein [Pseudomonadota bacterium]
MNQRINLVRIIPTVEKVKLCSMSILKINVLFLIILLLVYGYMLMQKRVLSQRLIVLQAEQSMVEASILEDGKKNGAHKVEADNLAQQIKNFEKEMELRQRVLSVLNQSEISNGNGFSSYFDELGKDIMSNVWLNRIRLQEGGEYVQLTGLAFRADDILSFMKTLYQGKVFGSKKLKLSEMVKTPDDPEKTSQEKKVIKFTLNTE